MQAIIMAAGKGSRLGSITNDAPKSFIEIKGKKLIEYNLDILIKYGITDITIVTGYKSEAFEKYTLPPYNVKLIYNPFYEMVNVLGSFFMGQEKINDDFIYMHADTLCDITIFENILKTNADIVLPIDYKPCDEEAMKIRCIDGKIKEISKKIPLELSEGEFIGIAKVAKSVIPALKAETIQLMKEKEFGSYFEAALQRVMDNYNFNIVPISTENAFWAEIDFAEDYEKAKASIPDTLVNI